MELGATQPTVDASGEIRNEPLGDGSDADSTINVLVSVNTRSPRAVRHRPVMLFASGSGNMTCSGGKVPHLLGTEARSIPGAPSMFAIHKRPKATRHSLNRGTGSASCGSRNSCASEMLSGNNVDWLSGSVANAVATGDELSDSS